MRKKKIRLFVFILFTLSAMASGATIWQMSNRETPENAIKDAREQISVAKSNAAAVMSPKLFQKAESLYAEAMQAWANENKKNIIRRDYTNVIELAKESTELAHQASANSLTRAADEKKSLTELYGFLKKRADKFRPATNKFPLPAKEIEDFHKADLLLREGNGLIGKEDYPSARKKLERASLLLSSSIAYTHAYLKNYYADYPIWQDWYALGLKKSESAPVIIVDKIAHKCYVYRNGKVTLELEMEMGKNWVGHKFREGDLTTPEGVYKVVQKKSRSKTIYYKALLIDYPNQTDLKRIKELTKGKKNHRPGSLIEIHGHGGQGFNWTKGCIALKDSDMDKVFSMASEGTMVVIMGSKEPFDKIEVLYFD